MANNIFAPPTTDEVNAANQTSMFAPPTPGELAQSQPPGFLEQTARNAVNELPAMGGIVGGIAGTPFDAVSGPMGNVVGAGIGGYLGTAAKNAINHYIDPQNSPQTTAQAMVQPIAGGLTQAAGQGLGEIAAPAVSGLIGKAASKLKGMAADEAVAATGATGKEAAKFSDDAGQELLDRGIVKFGNSQGDIADKLVAAHESAGQNIGNALSKLDSQGATIDQGDIVNELRKRASLLSDDSSKFDVSDSLNGLADRIQTRIDAKGGQWSTPLTDAEITKRGWQAKTNFNSTPAETSVAEEAGEAYRQAVENAATKVDPTTANLFQQEKQAYSLLKPMKEAAQKRAMTLQQSPKGGALDTATAFVADKFLGPLGAVYGPAVRRNMASRISPTLASIYSAGGNAAGSLAGDAATAVPAATQALGYGLMAPPPQPAPFTSYSTIPGKNGQ